MATLILKAEPNEVGRLMRILHPVAAEPRLSPRLSGGMSNEVIGETAVSLVEADGVRGLR
jgi:hypothetical protein